MREFLGEEGFDQGFAQVDYVAGEGVHPHEVEFVVQGVPEAPEVVGDLAQEHADVLVVVQNLLAGLYRTHLLCP